MQDSATQKEQFTDLLRRLDLHKPQIAPPSVVATDSSTFDQGDIAQARLQFLLAPPVIAGLKYGLFVDFFNEQVARLTTEEFRNYVTAYHAAQQRRQASSQISFALQQNNYAQIMQPFPASVLLAQLDGVTAVAYKNPFVTRASALAQVTADYYLKDAKIAVLCDSDAFNPGYGITVAREADTSILQQTNLVEILPSRYPNRCYDATEIVESGLTRIGWVYNASGVKQLSGVGAVLDVIVAAAPDFRVLIGIYLAKDYLLYCEQLRQAYINNMARKIRLIVNNAIANKNTHLILDAFGCGAKRNNPYLVAAIFRLVFAEFAAAIAESKLCIEFAITGNAALNVDVIFRQVLSGSVQQALALVNNPLCGITDQHYWLATLYLDRPLGWAFSVYHWWQVFVAHSDPIEFVREMLKREYIKCNVQQVTAKQGHAVFKQCLPIILQAFFPEWISSEDVGAFRSNPVLQQHLAQAIVFFMLLAERYPQYNECIMVERIEPFIAKVFEWQIADLKASFGLQMPLFYHGVEYQRRYDLLQLHAEQLIYFDWATYAFPCGKYLPDVLHEYVKHDEELMSKYKAFFLHTLNVVYGIGSKELVTEESRGNIELQGVLRLSANDLPRFNLLLRMLSSAGELHCPVITTPLVKKLREFLSTLEGQQLLRNYLCSGVKNWMVAVKSSQSFYDFFNSAAKDAIDFGQSVLDTLAALSDHDYIYAGRMPKALQEVLRQYSPMNIDGVFTPARLLDDIGVLLPFTGGDRVEPLWQPQKP